MATELEHRSRLVRRLIQLRTAVDRGTASDRQRELLVNGARAYADGSLFEDDSPGLVGMVLYWHDLGMADVNDDLKG